MKAKFFNGLNNVLNHPRTAFFWKPSHSKSSNRQQNNIQEHLGKRFKVTYSKYNTLMGLKHSAAYKPLKLKKKLLCSVLQISTKSITLTCIVCVIWCTLYVLCLCTAVLSFQRNTQLFLNVTEETYRNKLNIKRVFHSPLFFQWQISGKYSHAVQWWLNNLT